MQGNYSGLWSVVNQYGLRSDVNDGQKVKLMQQRVATGFGVPATSR